MKTLMLFSAIVLALTLIIQQANTQAPAGGPPLVLYKFEDATNLGLDSSGNSIDANNVGGTSGGGYQEGSRAVYLDGNSYLDAAINLNPAFVPQMTWGAWVKPTQVDNNRRQVLTIDNGGFDRTIGFYTNPPATSWSVFTGTGISTQGVSPTAGTWIFLAAVFDNDNRQVTFYNDLNPATFTTRYDSSTQSFLSIGRNAGGFNNGERFIGFIDDVFVYNRSLSQEEIIDIYNNGISSPSTSSSTSATSSTTASLTSTASASLTSTATASLTSSTTASRTPSTTRSLSRSTSTSRSVSRSPSTSRSVSNTPSTSRSLSRTATTTRSVSNTPSTSRSLSRTATTTRSPVIQPGGRRM